MILPYFCFKSEQFQPLPVTGNAILIFFLIQSEPWGPIVYLQKTAYENLSPLRFYGWLMERRYVYCINIAMGKCLQYLASQKIGAKVGFCSNLKNSFAEHLLID